MTSSTRRIYGEKKTLRLLWVSGRVTSFTLYLMLMVQFTRSVSISDITHISVDPSGSIHTKQLCLRLCSQATATFSECAFWSRIRVAVASTLTPKVKLALCQCSQYSRPIFCKSVSITIWHNIKPLTRILIINVNKSLGIAIASVKCEWGILNCFYLRRSGILWGFEHVCE